MGQSLRVLRGGVAADFDAALADAGVGPLRGAAITWLQINVGKLCNQACQHCHVEAGPKRTEIMTAATAEKVIELMDATPGVEQVDITGGAPELCPSFRRLVTAARAGGRQVIDRCNLTVLFEPGQEDTARFLADHGVKIVASLPCYSAGNVEKQRGLGVFDKSIEALVVLNELGYGRPDTGLELDLVYNPVGAFLPPPQATLEADYKARLGDAFKIVFNNLITITNMPISRFAHYLRREGKWDEYLTLLVNAFNPATVDGLMCRSLVSVGWDGALYDCDFNQMLQLPFAADGWRGRARASIWDLEGFADLEGRPIATDRHCFGCTAGAGSSCGGSLE